MFCKFIYTFDEEEGELLNTQCGESVLYKDYWNGEWREWIYCPWCGKQITWTTEEDEKHAEFMAHIDSELDYKRGK